MLDVGAVAARSGPPVAAEDEAAALVPAIEGLAGGRACRSSADTFSVEVARRALGHRARSAVNDISGGSDEMFELVAERGCGYVLMHIEGPPRVDRAAREYGDVVEHLSRWFGGRVERAQGLGVSRGADRDRPGPRLRPDDRAGPRGPAPARRAACPRPAALRLALAQGLHRRRAGRLLGGAPARRASASGAPSPPWPWRSAPAPTSSASTTAAPSRRCA